MGYDVIFRFFLLLFTWKTEIYFMEFIIKSVPSFQLQRYNFYVAYAHKLFGSLHFL